MNDPSRQIIHRTQPGNTSVGRGLALALLLFTSLQFSVGAQETPATPVAAVEIETPILTESTTPEPIVPPIAEETFESAVESEPSAEPKLQATPGDTGETPDTMTELVESAPDDNVEIVAIDDVELAPALEAELAELTENNDQITVAAVGLSPVIESPENVVAVLVGDGITFSNIGYVGAPGALGTFTGGSGIIGFEDGIILSTGVVSGVVGPNDRGDSTTNNRNPGDTDLTELVDHPTFDASVLTFDFVPQGNTVVFNYVFTSEEYNEYVNSQYNDVFAFYINGENCATVDGGRVSVNSINGGRPIGTDASNPELYVDNGGGAIDTQMDGLTVVMTCQATVQEGATNTIKLAIADTGDRVLDSNVFIQAKSFVVPTPTPTGSATVTATATATETPVATGTVTVSPTQTAMITTSPTETATPTISVTATNAPVHVTGLPNTGTGEIGDAGANRGWLIGLLGSVLLVLISAARSVRKPR
jgi:hypothetical protein